MRVFDYYQGFEGEPGIHITHANRELQSIAVIKLWYGYFRSIIDLINPNKNGNWEGVTLAYHLHTGWYDDERWECEDILLFLNQLESISAKSLRREEVEILNLLKPILREARSSSGHIFIEYD